MAVDILSATTWRSLPLQMGLISIWMVGIVPRLLATAPPMEVAFAVVVTLIWPAVTNWVFRLLPAEYVESNEDKRAARNKAAPTRPALLVIFVFNGTMSALQSLMMIRFGLRIGKIRDNLLPQDPWSPVSWARVCLEATMLLLLSDVFNYVYHRTFHEVKWLYQAFHYLHHQFQEPDGALAFYNVSPMDLFFSNILYMAGICLIPTDLISVYIFGFVAVTTALVGHSGLDLQGAFWAGSLHPRFHRMHHVVQRCNYCEHFTIVDRIMGTYRDG